MLARRKGKSLRSALWLTHAIVLVLVLPVMLVITELIRKSVIKEVTTSERRFTHIGKVALLEIDLIYDSGLGVQFRLLWRQKRLECLQNLCQRKEQSTS